MEIKTKKISMLDLLLDSKTKPTTTQKQPKTDLFEGLMGQTEKSATKIAKKAEIKTEGVEEAVSKKKNEKIQVKEAKKEVLVEQAEKKEEEKKVEKTEKTEKKETVEEIVVALFQKITKENQEIKVEKSEKEIKNELVTLTKSAPILEMKEKKEWKELQELKQMLPKQEQTTSRDIPVELVVSKGKAVEAKEEKSIQELLKKDVVFMKEEEKKEKITDQVLTKTEIETTKNTATVKTVEAKELKSYLLKELDTYVEIKSVSPKKIVIQLNPDNLGKMEVQIERGEKGEIMAKLLVEEEPSKEIVEKAMDEIKQVFEEKGTEFKFDIRTKEELKDENREEKRKEPEQGRAKDTKETTDDGTFEEQMLEI